MQTIDGRGEAKDTRELPGQPREFRKTATVQAVQMPEDFKIVTEEKQGENADLGRAGDYVCVGPAGEAWCVRREIFEAFEATYQPVDAVSANAAG